MRGGVEKGARRGPPGCGVQEVIATGVRFRARSGAGVGPTAVTVLAVGGIAFVAVAEPEIAVFGH